MEASFARVDACKHVHAKLGRCPDCKGVFESDSEHSKGGVWLPERPRVEEPY